MAKNWVFVHGTGVREQSLADTMHLIRERVDSLLAEKGLPAIDIHPCEWYKDHGIRLLAKGLSIPEYRRTGKLQNDLQKAEEEDVELWSKLNDDPWFELRGCALRPPPVQQHFTKTQFDARVEALQNIPEISEALRKTGILQQFAKAIGLLLTRAEYSAAVSTASHPSELRSSVARALVALAAARVFEKTKTPPVIDFDVKMRTGLVDLLADNIANPTASIFSWPMNALAPVAKALVTNFGCDRRGQFMDAVAPISGDILLYQVRGKQIRDYIAATISSLPGPIVLVAHSLGGIACVEMLIEKMEMPNVGLLVTIGSQAPFFYEINALQTLKYGAYLPERFPPWLNIYDPRDFLSFVGEQVFPRRPGELSPIQDHQVNNRLAFPESHSGYWANRETWNAVLAQLPK